MFNPTAVVIDAFVTELKQAYLATYSNLEPDYPGEEHRLPALGAERGMS